MVVLDANVAPGALAFAAKLANHAKVSVWFEPVSIAKVYMSRIRWASSLEYLVVLKFLYREYLDGFMCWLICISLRLLGTACGFVPSSC